MSYDDIKNNLWDRWEGIHKDVGYEIAIDSSVEGDNCLKVTFYEKDIDGEFYVSVDITDEGFESSLHDAHKKAIKVIDEIMEGY